MRLPDWLDKYLFETIQARFHPVYSNMTVIDWNKEQIRDYLGTYFPRSYVESYTIFSVSGFFFQTDGHNGYQHTWFWLRYRWWAIWTFSSTERKRPNITQIKVRVIEGNANALRSYERILCEWRKHTKTKIICSPSPIKIDDFYDLGILDALFTEKFDIILSFKAVCEFVTKQQFETQNPYKHLAGFMMPKLSEKGMMVLADISSKNEIANEWIPRYDGSRPQRSEG